MIKISESDFLEPSKVYTSQLKDAFHENAVNYFEELTKKSEINIEENKELVTKYNAENAKLANTNKALKKAKRLKGFLLFLVILLFVAIIGIVLLCTAYKSQKEKVKNFESLVAEQESKVKAAMNACVENMSPLCALFDYNMPNYIFTNTTPLIELDKVFDPAKYSKLHDQYGYEENNDNVTSTVAVQSGSILGNPFIIERNNNQDWRDHVYTGTLTITYTVRVKTSNGWSTQTRTQVLTAHVTKPEPYYYKDTWLILGSDAAPNLSFTRTPNEVAEMDDNKLDKYCKKYEGTLDKMVQDSLKKGGNFTRLDNTKFEAMFNALDRNNEMEFRLLMTPLGQRNLIQLMQNRDKTGYGDDFIFVKRKKLNLIKCRHAQGENIFDANPEFFYHYDYEACRTNFINFIDNYVKVLFFNFAPLLSVPLYQQFKAKEYIYKDTYKGNVTKAEVESMANAFNNALFQNKKSVTEAILKSKFVRRDGSGDDVIITGHSFEGIPRVTMVPTLGGDGKMHPVPVHWIEYLPVSEETPFKVQPLEGTYTEYKSGKFNDTIAKFGNPDKIIYRKRFISTLNK